MAFRGGNSTREDCIKFSQMYRAHIAPAQTVIPRGEGVTRGLGGGKGRGEGGGSNAGRVLCFWCFCPGVAMEDLRALGVSAGGKGGGMGREWRKGEGGGGEEAPKILYSTIFFMLLFIWCILGGRARGEGVRVEELYFFVCCSMTCAKVFIIVK